MANDLVQAEFNAWMAGVAEYHELSPAAQARCDAYLEDLEAYWQSRVDALDA